MKGVPAIAYSLRTHKKECDFTPYAEVVKEWACKVLEEGLPEDTCLNINFPEVKRLSGSRVCRMARGMWHTEWLDAGTDSEGKNIYTLTGTFCNLEPEATDTDYWTIDHGMAAITPLSLDMTDHRMLAKLKSTGKK
jgi:5'-nucleotidase